MNLQTFLINISKFLNDTLVPSLLALATLVFLWNVAKYFIMEGGNEEAHEKARSYAIWGIAAFVVIVSLWGIVNLLVRGLGFQGNEQSGDYMRTTTGGGGQGTDWGDINTQGDGMDNNDTPPDCTDSTVC